MADKFKGLPEIDLSKFGVFSTATSGSKALEGISFELADFKLHTTPESTLDWLKDRPVSNTIAPRDDYRRHLTHADGDGDGRMDDRVYGSTHMGMIDLPPVDQDALMKLYDRILNAGVRFPADYKSDPIDVPKK